MSFSFHFARLWRWLTGRLWIRPALYVVLAVAAVALATLTDRMVDRLPFFFPVPRSVIENLLSIIASSMLAVTIFAVSVMNAAFSSAIGATTPRAFEIVIADNAAKQALSSFIGAFIFAVIGLVGINFQSFGEPGRVVMFVLTLSVFAWVVGTLIYWIDYVTRLGQLRFTVRKLSVRVEKVLGDYLADPASGGFAVPAMRAAPEGAYPIRAGKSGVLQTVSVSDLISLAKSKTVEFDIALAPGDIVAEGSPLGCMTGGDDQEDTAASACACFTIGPERDPVQDPEMTIRLLAEIADRALSPGVNDPGTATDILDTLAGVLIHALAVAKKAGTVEGDRRVRVPTIDSERLVRAAFEQIARDGAGAVEVAERLQESLAAVATVATGGFAEACKLHSRQALIRAQAALAHDWERERVNRAAAWSAG